MQEAWSHDRPELSWEPEMNQSELIERLVSRGGDTRIYEGLGRRRQGWATLSLPPCGRAKLRATYQGRVVPQPLQDHSVSPGPLRRSHRQGRW
jgi:hypothetical protein